MTAGQRLGVAWGTLVLVALGVVLWAILVMRPANNSGAGDGLFANQTIHPSQTDGGASLVGPVATIAAYLVAPTATPTLTPTLRPTSTQQVVWQPDPCGSPEPGKLCRVPDRMPNTPTPYPSCYGTVEPGTWCRWWLMDDAPDGRTETR